MNARTQKKPSIVFCHGLWADGSCFSKLIPTLQADGFEVICRRRTKTELLTLLGERRCRREAVGPNASGMTT